MTRMLEYYALIIVFMFVFIIFMFLLIHLFAKSRTSDDFDLDIEKEMTNKKWDIISHDLNKRYKFFSEATNLLNLSKDKNGLEYFDGNPLRLVMIDALVEKAQLKLTERAKSYWIFGVVLYAFSFIMIILSSIFILFSDEILAVIKSNSEIYNESVRAIVIDQNAYIKEDIYRFFLTVLKRPPLVVF